MIMARAATMAFYKKLKIKLAVIHFVMYPRVAYLLHVALRDEDGDSSGIFNRLAHLCRNIAGHLVFVNPHAQTGLDKALGNAHNTVVVAAADGVRPPEEEKKDTRSTG